MKKIKNPWTYIPSLYFAEGLPYVLVNTLSVAMYKSMDVSNELIGYTGLLYLPWAIKFLWSPAVDGNFTKRKWILFMQLALGVLFVLVGITMQLPGYFYLSIAAFTLIAFVSATHDISIDGYYLHVLKKKEQAFFTGIRSTFYRISMIFGSGLLVSLAGYLGSNYFNIETGWTIAFVLSGIIFLILFFFHSNILPKPKTDLEIREDTEVSKIPFKTVFKEYFQQEKIVLILAFILLYRFGEGLLVKMAQPFLLDSFDKGGLNISLEKLGMMYGTFGVLALVIGGILGGWMIKQYSLRKLIWIMALSMNIPNLLYAYLAHFSPALWQVQISIIIEQFGYGFGFTGFMVYLLYISKGKFKTSLYAISTGIMAVGMMIPMSISGALQEIIGYYWLFLLSFVFTIPGMLLLFFIPLEEH